MFANFFITIYFAIIWGETIKMFKNWFEIFSSLFGRGAHHSVFTGYFWLHALELLLVDLGNVMRCQGSNVDWHHVRQSSTCNSIIIAPRDSFWNLSLSSSCIHTIYAPWFTMLSILVFQKYKIYLPEYQHFSICLIVVEILNIPLSLIHPSLSYFFDEKYPLLGKNIFLV